MADLITLILLFVIGLCFLVFAFYGIKRGNVAPPGLIAIGKNYNWGETDSKDTEGYWSSILIYFIIAFFTFSVAIAYLFFSI